ncbi:hypothetical protein JCM10295v2_005419 [Rhodotorula toruloides]
MTSGLDLSAPPSGTRPNGGASGTWGSAGEDDLEQDIARSRAERASRLTTGPSDDPRDTASARQNILNLVSAGQHSLSDSSSSTPSLAQFMGGGAQRRTHKVGTGMTDVEREETEKLEREMAATRAKWAAKTGGAAKAEHDEWPAGKGMSLASLMMGKPTGAKESPVAAKVAQRWQHPSSNEPSNDEITGTTPAPSLIEAKVVSRSPPTISFTEPKPASPSHQTQSTAPEPSTATDFGSRSSPLASCAANSSTLTRLQSSNIVSDRLKWSQSQQHLEKAAPKGPASPEQKRASVMEQWGRDEGADAAVNVSFAGIAGASNAEKEEDEKGEDQTKNAEIAVAKVEKVDEDDLPVTPVAGNVAPKLVRVTRDRARPTESTPRTAQPSLTDQSPNSAAQETPSAPAQAPCTPPSTASAGQKSYSKPSWQGAPISVKGPSKSSPAPATPHEAAPERRYTGGVALPGLSSSASPSFTPQSSSQPSISSFPSTPKAADSQPPPSPGRASVRDFAKRWSQVTQESSAAAKNIEALAAIKASYGVRAAPAKQVSMPVEQAMKKVDEPVKSKSVEVRPAEPRPAAAAAAPSQQSTRSAELPAPARPIQPLTAPARTASPPQLQAPVANAAAPAQITPQQFSQTAAPSPTDDIVSFLVSHKPSPFLHLSPGETVSLDVFHLNSLTDDPHPIDHNHVLFQNEILGIVHRAEPPKWSGEEADLRTNVWVWRGSEVVETKRTRERIERLKEKTGVEPLEVKYRHEPPALAEAFAGQLTICKASHPFRQGARDAFDHLDKRLFSVRSEEGVVYVEETDLSARSICSGFCSTFSTLGEVFAWLGEGSNELERQACFDFAESIADGRTVTILAEGEETALFWLEVGGTEYASAQYWLYRPHCPGHVSVVHVDSTSRPSCALSPALELSPTRVSIIDAAPHEIWIVVPPPAKERPDDIKLALDAAERLSKMWEQRGLPSRTPYHLLSLPSLIPRDLPFLSRQLDFAPLNGGTSPSKINVYTADEAKVTWLV